MPGIAVDTTTGIVYFTTQSIADRGVEGGIFSVNPTTKVITQIWRQDGSAGTLNSGILNSINVDDATGKYYVSIIGAGGTGGAIYVGNLSGIGVAPTLFETLPTYNSNTINPVPDGFSLDNAPTLSLAGANPTFTESISNPASSNNTPVALTTGATVGDTDNDKLAGATVAISGSFSGSGDSLYVLDVSTHRISGTFGGTSITVSEITDGSGNETLTLTGTDTLAHYQTVLNAVQFTSTSDNPTNYGANTSRTVSFTVNDGLLNSTAQTKTISVVGTNDAPVINAPVAQTFNEDAAAAFSGIPTQLVTDVDANPASQNIIVALSVAHGTLTVPTNISGGITSGGVVGNSSGTVTLTGTQSAINTTLHSASGLTYLSVLNYNGADTLTVTVNDQGNTGSGGAQQISSQVSITVNAVNDPVTAAAPATETVSEDSSVAVTGLSIADVDATLAPNGVYSVTLHAANGALTLTTTTGLTFDSGTANGSGTLTFHGTLSAINTALATASYAGSANYNGSDTIAFSVTDTFGGVVATGTGAATSDSKNVSVTVTAVNDPVTASAPSTATINEDASTAVSSLSISDVDATLAPNGVYAVTL